MSLGVLGGSGKRRSARRGARALGDSCIDSITNDPNSYTMAGDYTAEARAAIAECAAPAPSGGSKTTVTSSGGGGGTPGVPGHWQVDSRVKSLQSALNIDLKRFGCSSVLTVDGLIGPKDCGAMKFVSDAVVTTNSAPGAAFQDVMTRYGSTMIAACGGKGTTPWQPPSCPTPKAAAPVGLSSAQLLALQNALNVEVLSPHNYNLIAADGKASKELCGAADAAMVAVRNGTIQVSAALAAMLQDSATATVCNALYPWVIPTKKTAPSVAVKTVVPPSGPSGTDLMKQLQTTMNVQLTKLGFVPIAVTGTWTPETCGAAQTMNAALSKSDPAFTQIDTLFKQVSGKIGYPCGVSVTPVPPKLAKAAVTPAPPSGKKTSVIKDVPYTGADPCVIEYGDSSSVVKAMQVELNRLLSQNGYTPIAVTSKWDADTCGAFFLLGGQFQPSIPECGGPNWQVPAACPQKNVPKPSYKPPVKQASMVLPLGIAAVLVTVGLVVAKKKGLIMAAKKVGARA